MPSRLFTADGPDFYAVRDTLFVQYQRPSYEPCTGLCAQELDARMAAIVDGAGTHMARKSRAFALFLTHARIDVSPVDWFADHFEGRMRLDHLREQWRSAAAEGSCREAADVLRAGAAAGAFGAELDLGHASPGWQMMMKLGIPGLIARAREARAKHDGLTAEQTDFYDAVERVYDAMLRYTQRLAREALRTAELHPACRSRMHKLASCLDALTQGPPSTFYQALQLSYLFHQLIEFEGVRVRSMGGFDRTYGHFYEADLAAGRITADDASELIRFYFMKYFARTQGLDNGKNFYFGGLTRGGGEAANALTALALDVFYELRQTDPKLSVKLSERSPESLYRQVARCIRDGRNAMVLINDQVARQALLQHGRDAEDVSDYLLIGCYEPTIEGREISCNMSIRFSLAKPLELLMHRGVDPTTGCMIGIDTGDPCGFADFEQFFAAYEAQLAHQLRAVQQAIRDFEAVWPQINPSPLLSGALFDPVLAGADLSAGGAKYNNTGCMGAGLANAADSLLAVRMLVYERREIGMTELMKAMSSDFAGQETLRLRIVHRLPKWGNADPAADDMAVRITDAYAALVNGVHNNRGGQFTASLFSLDHNISLGRCTGALPDGRPARQALAKGIGASTALDKAGVTALIQSAGKLNYADIPNGSVLDIYLHPSAVAGEAGIQAIAGLIKAYFALGGFGIQFNVLDAEELRAAQQRPEEYATLQVRVCGWNVYFVTLGKEQQDAFIATTMQQLA